MIKNINIPAGAGSPKSRKSSADIGKPAPPALIIIATGLDINRNRPVQAWAWMLIFSHLLGQKENG
jgi:hypothetical protein